MKILILEDSEERIYHFKKRLIYHTVKITDKPKECIEWLKNDGPWDYIFLDHDMGNVHCNPSEGTGWEVAKWIADHPEFYPTETIYLHTMNPIGAAAMTKILSDANLKSTYIPLLWKKIIINNEI